MPSPRLTVAALLAAAIPCVATSVRADEVIRGHAIDRSTDGVVIGGAFAAVLGLSLVPVPAQRALWTRELFGNTDAAAYAQFSPRAAGISDAVLAAAVAAPIGYLIGNT